MQIVKYFNIITLLCWSIIYLATEYETIIKTINIYNYEYN